ncbi:MAG: VOC family protein [Chloroflexota bacterium]
MAPSVEVILWVASQERARAFWRAALAVEPVLDVPGMTAFDLDGVRLGLMPRDDVADLLGRGVVGEGGAPDAELYLRVDDVAAAVGRFLAAGRREISAPALRPWGEVAGYGLDPDGHVVALASRGGAA